MDKEIFRSDQEKIVLYSSIKQFIDIWDKCVMKNPAYEDIILEHFKDHPKSGKGTWFEMLFMKHMEEQISENNPQNFNIGITSYEITNQQPFTHFYKGTPNSH